GDRAWSGAHRLRGSSRACGVDRRVTSVRAWLDRTPLAALALSVMREATGQQEPLEAIVPSRPAALATTARVGFWSMSAGAGTSTLAALVAQRSAGAGRAPLLVDLDQWTPSLALRAAVEAATILDVLVQPDREREMVSRWATVPFIPGSPALHRQFDAERIGAMLERVAPQTAIVMDLGAGPAALDPALTSRLTRLVLVVGTTAAQLQAAFCARPLLRDVRA